MRSWSPWNTIVGTYHGQTLPLVVMLHGCTQSPDDFAASEMLFGDARPKARRACGSADTCHRWSGLLLLVPFVVLVAFIPFVVTPVLIVLGLDREVVSDVLMEWSQYWECRISLPPDSV